MTERTEPVIVVGMDGSSHSKEALRWAVEQAKAVGGRVEAVLSWQWSRNPFDVTATALDEEDTELLTAEEAARRELAEAVGDAVGAEPGAPVSKRVVQGVPARVLVDASEKADLMVVGTRGYGGFKAAMLGSVSQQVVQHAKCSVVVVRPPAGG
ncbi:universal stress protein [Streptomyces sp. NRRL S-87]|uniref:universal stress protein n=1 Tax=Streptomyces sp. NRRL S-87 TaxID=1463920 RepID=UPI0004C11C73|nr:universal stress protein [Streptomyces sp. NRRL S-87]